jgi:cellulose synthase/poly-beta-1,6-N-acetylglucosamine synthase-like glycosyltransferase
MLLPSILVIDNDPMASARAVVIAAAVDSPVTLRYVVEPRPGIAAARNRALLEAENADVLVFLDDDERPTASWLVPLIDTWERSGAAAVMGRVISVFDTPLEPWIAAGEFFRRRSMPTGTEIEVGAAGNLLLDLMQVHQLGVQFDERIALGAGEDSLFTRQLVQRGGRLVWCEESVATDHVPPQRMTRRWVLDRARSHGNTEVVVELLVATTAPARRRVRALAAMRGGIRVAAGAARFSLGLVAGSLRHQARGLRTAYRGLGMASAALGVVVHEYARNHEHANI